MQREQHFLIKVIANKAIISLHVETIGSLC